MDDVALTLRISPPAAMSWPFSRLMVASGGFAPRTLALAAERALIIFDDERDGTLGSCFRSVGNFNIYDPVTSSSFSTAAQNPRGRDTWETVEVDLRNSKEIELVSLQAATLTASASITPRVGRAS